MNKFDFKLGSAVAIATFVATVIAPAGLADTTVDLANNGANSTTNVVVNNTSDGGSIKQTNYSNVINTVSVKQVTGKNTASNNTGGDTGIVTGDANSNVKIKVKGSSNNAAIENPCNCENDTTVNVADNGADSTNNVVVNNGAKSGKKVTQTNVSSILNIVAVKQVTGKNKAKNNTGGSTGIGTGNTTSNVKVKVTGASNTYAAN